MFALKRIGFFEERAITEPGDNSIYNWIGKAGDQSSNIIAYLKDGAYLATEPALKWDILSDAHHKICGAGVLTDGLWCWPTDLFYYVSRYDVGVPDQFLDHMQAKNWKVGKVDVYALTQVPITPGKQTPDRLFRPHT